MILVILGFRPSYFSQAKYTDTIWCNRKSGQLNWLEMLNYYYLTGFYPSPFLYFYIELFIVIGLYIIFVFFENSKKDGMK